MKIHIATIDINASTLPKQRINQQHIAKLQCGGVGTASLMFDKASAHILLIKRRGRPRDSSKHVRELQRGGGLEFPNMVFPRSQALTYLAVLPVIWQFRN